MRRMTSWRVVRRMGIVLAVGLILGMIAAPRSVPAGQEVSRSVPH